MCVEIFGTWQILKWKMNCKKLQIVSSNQIVKISWLLMKIDLPTCEQKSLLKFYLFQEIGDQCNEIHKLVCYGVP